MELWLRDEAGLRKNQDSGEFAKLAIKTFGFFDKIRFKINTKTFDETKKKDRANRNK